MCLIYKKNFKTKNVSPCVQHVFASKKNNIPRDLTASGRNVYVHVLNPHYKDRSPHYKPYLSTCPLSSVGDLKVNKKNMFKLVISHTGKFPLFDFLVQWIPLRITFGVCRVGLLFSGIFWTSCFTSGSDL